MTFDLQDVALLASQASSQIVQLLARLGRKNRLAAVKYHIQLGDG